MTTPLRQAVSWSQITPGLWARTQPSLSVCYRIGTQGYEKEKPGSKPATGLKLRESKSKASPDSQTGLPRQGSRSERRVPGECSTHTDASRMRSDHNHQLGASREFHSEVSSTDMFDHKSQARKYAWMGSRKGLLQPGTGGRVTEQQNLSRTFERSSSWERPAARCQPRKLLKGARS